MQVAGSLRWPQSIQARWKIFLPEPFAQANHAVHKGFFNYEAIVAEQKIAGRPRSRPEDPNQYLFVYGSSGLVMYVLLMSGEIFFCVELRAVAFLIFASNTSLHRPSSQVCIDPASSPSLHRPGVVQVCICIDPALSKSWVDWVNVQDLVDAPADPGVLVRLVVDREDGRAGLAPVELVGCEAVWPLNGIAAAPTRQVEEELHPVLNFACHCHRDLPGVG